MKIPFSMALGLALWGGFLIVGSTPAFSQSTGSLKVKIQHPVPGTVLTGSETSIEVRGGASVFGGVKQLDLVLLLDTSSSLKRTDPEDYRKSGAIELIESLPEWSDIQVGVVSFGRKAKLLSPLSADRALAVRSLRDLGRGSTTNLAGGIDMALQAFEQGSRENSMRLVLVFTDGRSDENKARAAMKRAQTQGVAIHSLMLGRDRLGEKMLREMATGTGGSFLAVTDPAKLPAAFRNLRTTGVESVTLRVNDSEPIPTFLSMGSFSSEVPLVQGENRISAIVTSLDGRTRSESVTVTVRPNGCAELTIGAVRDGQPAISLSDRSVEIVMDASRSMWGQLEGRAKMEIAKQMLDDALDWLPEDLALSLRVYGHQHAPSEHNCKDTELLVAAGADNRDQIRSAVAALRPKGQTPLGYSLEQIGQDFANVRGERAVVLVTDGIESCGGNAAAAAQTLQAEGSIPVHVIGFGMGDSSAEDLASLRAIADASGGRFVEAGNARELQQALMTTVGTPFRVSSRGTTAATGTLGSEEILRLPAGEYTVKIDSDPPRETQVTLDSEVRQNVVFSASAADAEHETWIEVAEYSSCDQEAAALEAARQSDTAPVLAVPASPAPPPAKNEAKEAPKALREAAF